MKITLGLFGGCGLLLTVLLFTTNPGHVFSFILIIPFLLLFGLIALGMTALLQYRGYTRLRALRMAAFLTVLPVILLVFQSIGQLTSRDFLTIMALFVISYFYVSRASARTNN